MVDLSAWGVVFVRFLSYWVTALIQFATPFFIVMIAGVGLVTMVALGVNFVRAIGGKPPL